VVRSAISFTDVGRVDSCSATESSALFDDPRSPQRAQYLARFADKEGREFTARFYRRYAGKPPAAADELLARSARATPAIQLIPAGTARLSPRNILSATQP